MHQEVRNFIREVRWRFPAYFFFSDVVEFGSLNVNGAAKEYFYFCDYVGVDLGYGRGVNVICEAHKFKSSTKFDAVLSTEMLEHDATWKLSLMNMYRLLKPNGLMLVTCAGVARDEHGTRENKPKDSPYTNDYYHNISIKEFESVLPPELFEVGCLKYERDEQDLMFMGIKKDYMQFKNHE